MVRLTLYSAPKDGEKRRHKKHERVFPSFREATAWINAVIQKAENVSTLAAIRMETVDDVAPEFKL